MLKDALPLCKTQRKGLCLQMRLSRSSISLLSWIMGSYTRPHLLFTNVDIRKIKIVSMIYFLQGGINHGSL
mgnify:CR=1 FL=1